ncbi:MAG: hypothetical protein ACTSVV_09695 [Promethearchaeota archaeon]
MKNNIDFEKIKNNKNWLRFIHFCQKMKFGVIESLVISDGVPMHAKEAKHNIRFDKDGELE